MGKLAVLFLVLATGAPAVNSTLLNLVMPDARVLSGVNVAQARTSLFGQFLLSRSAQTDPEFAKFIQSTGFDPRQNLIEILFAAPAGAQNQSRLVLARGAFDIHAITSFAQNNGAEISTYRDVTLIGKKRGHGGPMSLAFPDGSIALAGDTDSVRAAIDRYQGAPGGPSRELADKVNALSAVQDAWFVSVVPASEFAAHVPDANANGLLKGDALKSIDQASGGLKFGDGVALSAEIVTRTAQDASSLADVFRFLVSLGQLQQRPQNAPLQSLLSSLTLKSDGNTVKLALSIPEKQLESLVAAGHGAHH